MESGEKRRGSVPVAPRICSIIRFLTTGRQAAWVLARSGKWLPVSGFSGFLRLSASRAGRRCHPTTRLFQLPISLPPAAECSLRAKSPGCCKCCCRRPATPQTGVCRARNITGSLAEQRGTPAIGTSRRQPRRHLGAPPPPRASQPPHLSLSLKPAAVLLPSPFLASTTAPPSPCLAQR